jgi:hypothetical protein
VRRGAEQHQSAAHADDVLLTLEDIGHVDLDARVLFLLGLEHLVEDATAARALVVVRLVLVRGIRQLGRGADEGSQRLLRLDGRRLLHVVPLPA